MATDRVTTDGLNEFVDYKEAARLMGISNDYLYPMLQKYSDILQRYVSKTPYKAWLRRADVLRVIQLRGTPQPLYKSEVIVLDARPR